MTLLPIGIALCIIWFMNLVWIVREFVRHTPNWKDEDVTSDEIVQNFMANTPLEKIEFIMKIAEFNPVLGMSGLSCLLLAFIF